MKVILLFLMALGVSGCANWPKQSAALDAAASGLAAPALLPQDQLQAPQGNTGAEADGAALAARAAALRG